MQERLAALHQTDLQLRKESDALRNAIRASQEDSCAMIRILQQDPFPSPSPILWSVYVSIRDSIRH
eukprot:307314-Amphidinium_carterae.1